MQYMRKTAVGLLASLLVTLLILFGVAFGVQRTFHSPEAIKSALRDSGFYKNAVANALDQAQKGEQDKGQGGQKENDIPIDQPEVKAIIQNAASPEYLQTQTEGVLDSVYAWLKGETPKLSFVINLADAKARLADGIGQYTAERLTSLPACAPGTVPSGDVDPFGATCRPQGVDVNQVAAEAKNQIQNGEFLKESQLTADSIKTGENGKTLSQQLEGVPEGYQKLNQGFYALGLLVLLLAAGVLFLSTSRRSGIKKLAILAIAAGALVAFIGWLGSFALQRAADTLKEPLQQSAVKVAELLANDLRTWWMGYGIVLIVLSVAALLALHFTKPKPATEPEGPGEAAPEPSAALKTDAQPADKTKPKPVKKLVQ